MVLERDAQVVSVQLPGDPAAARAARLSVREALQRWRLGNVADVAELLTGELVSNVVRHVGSPARLSVVRQPSAIRVEVEDPSAAIPVRRDPDPSEDCGRGILLVESLASAWGVDLHGEGKTVWFELDVEGVTPGRRRG
jgi:anti-sigma regulatory factor (Ser/Thr protein kinase)